MTKKLTPSNSDEVVEWQEFSFTADGSVKDGITTLEDSLAISQKAKHSLLHDPAIMLLGIYDNELKTVHTKTRTRCL